MCGFDHDALVVFRLYVCLVVILDVLSQRSRAFVFLFSVSFVFGEVCKGEG